MTSRTTKALLLAIALGLWMHVAGQWGRTAIVRAQGVAQTKALPMFLNVLFDTDTKMLLGRGGKWVSYAEFERDPPQNPEDLMSPPSADNPRIPDLDPPIKAVPGPQIKCVSGHYVACNDLHCTMVLKNGGPVPCK